MTMRDNGDEIYDNDHDDEGKGGRTISIGISTENWTTIRENVPRVMEDSRALPTFCYVFLLRLRWDVTVLM